MFSRSVQLLAASLLLVVITGCGSGDDPWKAKRPKTVPGQGVLTLDGKPLDAAQVVFVGGTGASGLSDEEGRFTLSAFTPDEGIVPGSYRVMIVKSNVPEIQEPANEDVYTPPTVATLLVPQKYTDPNTSGLTVEIPAAGNTDIKLDLVSK